MAASDFRTNSAVRSVLARHWIDLQRIKFGCFRGTVRFGGTLAFLGARTASRIDSSKLETLEREVKRVQGVSRVYFDFKNWKKGPNGEWTCLERQTATSGELLDTQEEADQKPGQDIVDVQAVESGHRDAGE